MKSCVVNSSELSAFGVWSAEFYNNTNAETRKDILAMEFRDVKKEVEDLRYKLQDMKGYKTVLMKVKDEMGLNNGARGYGTPALRFPPSVNLLVVKTAAIKLKEYQNDKLKELQEDQERIQEDMKKLGD